MSEETKATAEGIESPFDKETEATTAAPAAAAPAPVAEAAPAGTEAPAEAPVETPAEAAPVAEAASAEAPAEETAASRDYSKYAAMAEAPQVNERRSFDYVAVSGKVDTEVVTVEGQGDVERRLPAKAVKLLLTQERGEDDRPKSEELELPLTVIPVKYRMVMEQRAGSQGEILVLKTSEFDGKTSDIVTVSRYSPDGKIVETSAPMTVAQARKKYRTSDDKMALRDKVHLYSLVGGDLVRFVVKGTGLWEQESELHNGKTAESQAKYPFLSRYLSEFPATDPYFLYEMKVGAAYRDHGSIKYYRPTFTKGARISTEVEDQVIAHLEDLHKYFAEMDEATKAFVPEEAAAVVADDTPVVATDAPAPAEGADDDY